jgi:hypothetical protein
MSKAQAFLDAVLKGDAQLDAGHAIAYTPAVLQAITEAALKERQRSEPIDPAVLPQEERAIRQPLGWEEEA